MVQYSDPEAGVAIFRQGRSLCIRLDGTLGVEGATGIREQLRADRSSVRLRLECSRLLGLDPDAGPILAGAVLDWVGSGGDRSIDVLNLPPDLDPTGSRATFRLFGDPDELVFLDPDRREPPGTPSPSHR